MWFITRRGALILPPRSLHARRRPIQVACRGKSADSGGTSTVNLGAPKSRGAAPPPPRPLHQRVPALQICHFHHYTTILGNSTPNHIGRSGHTASSPNNIGPPHIKRDTCLPIYSYSSESVSVPAILFSRSSFSCSSCAPRYSVPIQEYFLLELSAVQLWSLGTFPIVPLAAGMACLHVSSVTGDFYELLLDLPPTEQHLLKNSTVT